MAKERTSGLTAAAGEHFATAELARRGFLVTLTRGSAPGIDVLAYLPRTRRTAALQVKTADGKKQSHGKWIMNAKDEDEFAIRSDAFIFVFLPKEFGPAEFSIVPSKIVARTIYSDHRKWESTRGAKGQQRSLSNTMRHFKDPEGKWRNRWDVVMASVEDVGSKP